MEFRPDGTFVRLMIGRGDAPSPGASGRWDTTGRLSVPPPAAPDSPTPGLAGPRPGPAPTGPGPTGRIVSVEPDRLEIAWQE